MKKSLIIIIFLSFSSVSIFSQDKIETENDLFVYSITKKVDNHFDSTFFGKAYRLSIQELETSREKVVEKRMKHPDLDSILLRNPDYFSDLKKELSDPIQLQNYFHWEGIYLSVDGVGIEYFDTATFKELYEESINEFKENEIGTTFSWDLKDFESIPLISWYGQWAGIQIIAHKNRVDTNQLENGRYVMFYEPIYDYKKDSFSPKVPYCYFEIKNHKPNGKALFLTHLGDTLAMGSYVNGIQEGEWKINLPCSNVPKSLDVSYERLLLNGKIFHDSVPRDIYGRMKYKFPLEYEFGWCNYKLNFVKGKIEGDFIFKQDGDLRSKGSMKNNKPIGNWNFYYKNGQLANSFTLREEPLELNDKSVYPIVSNHIYCDLENAVPYSPKGPECIDVLPVGNKKSTIIGLHDLFYINKFEGYDPPLGNEVQFFQGNDYRGRKMLVIDEFKAYYENGDTYFKMKINNDGKLAFFSSKIYDEKGDLLVEWFINKNQTKAIVVYHYEEGKSIYKVYVENRKQHRELIKRKPLRVIFWKDYE